MPEVVSINSTVCKQSLKVTTAHLPWENKRLGELFGISGQFTDKNIVQSIYLYCKTVFLCYILLMNYPTTQSSLLERVQQGDEI